MKSNSGFTIMELMIVLAIIGILSSIAIPNMIAWRSNHQINSMAREVMSVIQGARQKAIKWNSNITITLDTVNGQITRSQRNRSIADPLDPDAFFDNSGSAILVMRPGLSMTTNFTNDQIIYNNRGMLANGLGGRVIIRSSNGLRRQVVLSSTGKPRIDT